MNIYAHALAGPAEQSAFAVIVLTGALLALGGVWGRRRAATIFRRVGGR